MIGYSNTDVCCIDILKGMAGARTQLPGAGATTGRLHVSGDKALNEETSLRGDEALGSCWTRLLLGCGRKQWFN